MAKQIIIKKGTVIDYQTMIEAIAGQFLARNMNYKYYNELPDVEKDKTGRSSDARSRAWFVGDADYEMIVRKKRK